MRSRRCRRSWRRPGCHLRHPRGDPPGSAPPRGRGIPRPVDRTDRRAGLANHVLLVDRFVGRRELGALARGRRRLRDALPEPRPDRVGHDVLRDERRQGDRVDAVRLCDELLAGGSRRARRAGLGRTRSVRPSSGCWPTPSAGHHRRDARTRTAASMIWPEVGAAYRRLFARVVGVPAARLTLDARVAHADV